MSGHQKNFISLLKHLKLPKEDQIKLQKNWEIKKIIWDKNTLSGKVYLKQLQIIPLKLFKIFNEALKSNKINLDFIFGSQGTLKQNAIYLKDYLEEYFKVQKIPQAQYSLFEYQVDVFDNLICNFNFSSLKLKLFLRNYGILLNKIITKDLIKNQNNFRKKEIYKYQKKLETQKIKKEYLRQLSKNLEKKSETSKVYYRKTIVKGKILRIREWINKNKQNLEILLDCFPDEAIFVICKNFVPEDVELLKVNHWIAFKGFLHSKNNKFYSSHWSAIKQEFTRKDCEIEKRVELHLHTKMSSLDGIGRLEDYFAYASHWNHQALAITDHENVHAFAKCETLQKKYPKIKIIYGCEFNFLRNNHWVVNVNKDLLLSKEKLLFFDIETTGLSMFFDEIIEFAYIIIKNGLTLKKETFFIQSKQKIPAKIFEITKIDPKNYSQEAIPKEEAVKRIHKILADHILVAHNASFDVGFVNRLFALYKLPQITNVIIDTLNLSRLVDNELYSHRLTRVARKYKIWFKKEKVHRALYDSEILKKVFQHIISENKIYNLKQLYAFNNHQKIIKKAIPNHLILLAKNRMGLKTLYRLVSLTHTKTLYRKPTLKIEDLEKNRHHLLVGSSCYNGEIFDAALWKDTQTLEEKIKFYDYLEIQPPKVYKHYVNSQKSTAKKIKQAILRIIKTAQKLNKKVVATGDVHYVNKDDVFYRNVFVFNKQLGGRYHPLFMRDHKPETPLQHFRTTTEMLEAFAFLDDPKLINELVIKNSQEIASKIEKFDPFDEKFIMPKWEGHHYELEKLAFKKLLQKYGKTVDPLVKKRFLFELEKIINFGYTTIYLISYALTNFSLENGYLFGSRGSVGSSFLAYCLDITEVNPLEPHYLCKKCFYFEWNQDKSIRSGFDLDDRKCPKCQNKMYKDGHHIQFSSFLGLNFTNVPDIDLNFSGEFQQKAQEFVMQFLYQKLGDLKVFRTGTISTVAERLAYNYFKTYQENYHKYLDKEHTNLTEPQESKIINYCSGIKKTTGQHPGGLMIIAKECDIFDYTPYNFPSNKQENNNYTTHFDYHFLHNKLLKIDVLGHDDPTGLKLLHQMTKQNPNQINLSDPKIFKLFCNGKVLNLKGKIDVRVPAVIGIPEFGTKFVIKMLKNLKIKKFSNLISVSGLSHGKNVWENNAKNLIENDHHFTLENVISCRDDIFDFLTEHQLSEEFAYQIMQKVKKGKKLSNEEIKILKKYQIPKWYIESCQKIKYLFPKAHATAYVIMAARFAWYKIYYPHEFYAVYYTIRTTTFDLSIICGGFEKIESEYHKIINFLKSDPYNKLQRVSTKSRNLLPIFEMAMEMYDRGIKLENLSLQFSEAKKFIVKEIDGKKHIIPPFCTVDLLGEETAKKIVEERNKKQFTTWDDFKKRTKINQTAFDNLHSLGIFETLKKSRQKTFSF